MLIVLGAVSSMSCGGGERSTAKDMRELYVAMADHQQRTISFQDAAFAVPDRSGAGANVPFNLSRNSSVNCTRMIKST